MTETIVKMLNRLAKPAYVKDKIDEARRETGGPNACAATLSLILKDLGLIDKVYKWTAQLVGTEDKQSLLEQTHAMVRIMHPADVLPGDIVASRDRPQDGNRAPDHVFVIVGRPEGPDLSNPFAPVIDNYCRNGKPYWRNLGRSGLYGGAWRKKTPMAYALRLVDPPEANHGARKHRQQLVNALKTVYREAKLAKLSQPTEHHLNQLRWSVELRDFDVE